MGSGAVGVEFASHLPTLRQRGDHLRAAAAAGAGRGRSDLGRAREIVPQARHHVSHRRQGDQRQGRAVMAWTSRHSSPTARRNEIRGRLPAGGHRTRTGNERSRDRRQSDCRLETWIYQGRRAVPNQRAGHFRRLATSSRLARQVIRNSRMCRRRKASLRRSGLPVRRRGRSTTITCLRCTYCDPEIGSVGLTEREAQARGYDVARGHVPVRRARLARRLPARPKGFVKIVAERRTTKCSAVTHDRSRARPNWLPRPPSRCGSRAPSKS